MQIKLNVKDIDISSGGPYIAVMNREDALTYDFNALDRIKISFRKKNVIAVLDIDQGNLEKGQIGFFEEVLLTLGVKNNDPVKISLQKRPKSVDFIKKKLDKQPLSKREIEQIVNDVVNNRLSEPELTYFVAACYVNKMDVHEIKSLIDAIVKNGKILKIHGPIYDLHGIGGIPGNKITMLVVPIIAAAGLKIVKTSTRSITSASGTSDTMEVLANVSFTVREIKKIVQKTNACMVWGGTMELASADDKFIKIEYPLSLDPESILLASIISKKCAVSTDYLLLEIPVGKGAKIQNMKKAYHLKKKFLQISKKFGIKTKIIFTDGSQPVGNGIGPALEARDVLYALQNSVKAPPDLLEKALTFSSLLLEMAHIKNPRKKAEEILYSGLAYKKMKEIIKAQKGNPNIFADDIPVGKFSYTVKTHKSGKIIALNNKMISKIARVAGAPKNKGAGIYLHVHPGNNMKKNDRLFTIYAESREKLLYAKSFLEQDIINIK